MDETGSKPKDRRRHPRYPIAKKVRVRQGENEATGVTRNISAGGAAIDIEFDLGEDEVLELDIEDVGIVEGLFARRLEDGFAVQFVDLDDEDEAFLLAEIEALKSSMDLDDE